MRNKWINSRAARRAAALFLTAALLLGIAPVTAPQAQAAHWADEYINKLVDWGVMRGDLAGNMDPDRAITRAEFVTMVNRAYGYDELGPIPFQDVLPTDWFYEDIAIAYNTGYYLGTSVDGTTASPLDSLTKEQAAVLMGRNMMLEEGVGESLSFSDTREFADWSRGLIDAVADSGIITGDPNGSFYPKNYIKRGEVAAMLVRAIGNPLNQAGDYTLDSVYGNVTINTSGVTLRDTVIGGDLYLTGGVGLGDVKLENVTVLGKIVVSGAGESAKGDSSVVLRNVQADEMILDSMSDQYVTLRAEGDTSIGTTSVRTHGFLEDVTTAGAGLELIELDGDPGITLDLAGNIKEVVNLTPESTLRVVQGVANMVTVDEEAYTSTLTIENAARIKELNLDTATQVLGTGDIAHLNVNSAGSTVAMLPDTIDVRPGLTADVAGETMDNVAAAESSEDPRLLAGYPLARDVAPSSATAVFSTNKKGTVYWALSALADGSVGEDDLLDPPVYGSKILQSGTVTVGASNTEVSAALTQLTSDGSYYISAVMVDARGEVSPVKVTAFTTPDDTVPDFADGYPYLSKITRDSAQVTVMPTKSCQLYYALLPKGAVAPTPAEFRANAVTGNVGYGSLEVTKNTALSFYVNGQPLKELESYDLYLWLTDFDGANSSKVEKLSFTTVDETPPVFVIGPNVTKIQPTGVTLSAAINEAGTIYWVVVAAGEEYPKPMAGQTVKPALNSPAAKLQVANGMNCLKSGKTSAAANREVNLNVTGLTAQTTYDLYYMAQDSAGNYSEWIKVMTINTLDTQMPTVTQEFTKTTDAEGKEPMPDTDIRIVFSEGVQDLTGHIFLDLYAKATDPTNAEYEDAQKLLLELLRKNIKLMNGDSFTEQAIQERTAENEATIEGDWVDYRYVTITMDEGRTVFTFKSGEAISLSSGSTYYFRIADIADTSNNKNVLKPNPLDLPKFTTTFAKINLTDDGVSSNPLKEVTVDGVTTWQEVEVDMTFQMHPTSTANVADSIFYDVFLWTDTTIRYDLYARVLDANGNVLTDANGAIKDVDENGQPDDWSMFSDAYITGMDLDDTNGWLYLGNDSITSNGDQVGKSVNLLIHNYSTSARFAQLNSLQEGWTYEFAISLTQIGTLVERPSWSDEITIAVTIPAGTESRLRNLATTVTEGTWDNALGNGITAIGSPEDFSVARRFSDTSVPSFTAGYPVFYPGDTFVDIEVQLNRPGTIYYVIAPMAKVTDDGYNYSPAITTRNTDGYDVEPEDVTKQVDTGEIDGNGDPIMKTVTVAAPPDSGADIDECPDLEIPIDLNIYQPSYSSSRIKSGSIDMEYGIDNLPEEDLTDLEPETIYYAYFVLKGVSQNLSPVYCFQFTTENVTKPYITLENDSPRVWFETSTSADLDYVLVADNNSSLPGFLRNPFSALAPDATGSTTDGVKVQFNATDYDDAMDGVDGTFSVLDALLNTIDSSKTGVIGYSVFDIYASETLKQTVAEFIRTGAASGILPVAALGSMEGENGLLANIPKDEDFFEDMTEGTRYFCLAVAHNSQGTIDAFAAVANIQKPDMVPPSITSVSTIIDKHYTLADGNGTPTAGLPSDLGENTYTKYSYSGTVTIIFDKPVYFVAAGASGMGKEVWQKINIKNADPTDTDAVYFHNHVLASFDFAGAQTIETASNMIMFTFDQVVMNDTMTIFTDGWVANAGGYATQKRLTLRFDPTMTTADQYPDQEILLPVPAPGFRYTWS